LYTSPATRFMTKITSGYSREQNDRNFKFTTVSLCKASKYLSSEFDTPPGRSKKTFEKEMALWQDEIYTNLDKEVLHLKEDMKNAQIPWKNFSDFNKWDFNSSALLIPEQELRQLILPDRIEHKVLKYVSEGGTLIVCGSGQYWSPEEEGRGASLLNRIFGFYITKYGFEWSGQKALTNSTGCGIFCGVDEVEMHSTTVTVSIDSLPPQALVAFVKADDSKATPAFTIPYKNGLIVYLGFDWWSSPRTGWNTLLQLAYGRTA